MQKVNQVGSISDEVRTDFLGIHMNLSPRLLVV